MEAIRDRRANVSGQGQGCLRGHELRALADFASVANAQMPTMQAPSTASTTDIPAAMSSPKPANGPDPAASSELRRNLMAIQVARAAIDAPQMARTRCSADA